MIVMMVLIVLMMMMMTMMVVTTMLNAQVKGGVASAGVVMPINKCFRLDTSLPAFLH